VSLRREEERGEQQRCQRRACDVGCSAQASRPSPPEPLYQVPSISRRAAVARKAERAMRRLLALGLSSATIASRSWFSDWGRLTGAAALVRFNLRVDTRRASRWSVSAVESARRRTNCPRDTPWRMFLPTVPGAPPLRLSVMPWIIGLIESGPMGRFLCTHLMRSPRERRESCGRHFLGAILEEAPDWRLGHVCLPGSSSRCYLEVGRRVPPYAVALSATRAMGTLKPATPTRSRNTEPSRLPSTPSDPVTT